MTHKHTLGTSMTLYIPVVWRLPIHCSLTAPTPTHHGSFFFFFIST